MSQATSPAKMPALPVKNYEIIDIITEGSSQDGA
jgi:hypothetical protein